MTFAALALAALLGSASAFAPVSTGKASSPTSSLASSYSSNPSWQMPPALGGPGNLEFFPLDIPMKRIEGGGTVRTWDIPPETERLQYVVETNGRPLKAKVEL